MLGSEVFPAFEITIITKAIIVNNSLTSLGINETGLKQCIIQKSNASYPPDKTQEATKSTINNIRNVGFITIIMSNL